MCLKMNGNDISRLSYKELQALALRYRVPGNIKKKLLVKVLQAAEGGNENEVGRLLQDLKQNRKRKVRKIKSERFLGLTSTPLHSPDYVMADDYYCPQQQPPYQWVGAEEEIVSRDDESRIPHYEEFKEFLLKKIQKEFQTYDANNNQIQNSAIVDLRTATISQNAQRIPLDNNNYTTSNVITTNNNDSCSYQPNDHVEYQTLEDTNNNIQGSILLKKMLQAPVGANLGEIASPVIDGYRLWGMDRFQSNHLLDNSDTLTAESDNQDNEENLENTMQCYGLLSGMKGEYLLNEPTFEKHVDEIGQQVSNVLTNENVNQYKYSTNIEMHQDYENWTIANVMDDALDANCATSEAQTSKIYQTVYYDNTGSSSLDKPINNENLTYQYRTNENIHGYNSNKNSSNLNSMEQNQYYETNVIPSVQSNCNSTYYLQNSIKCTTETNEGYIQSTHSYSNANINQDTSTVSQTFSNNYRYNSNPLYEYSYFNNNNHENPIPSSGNFQQQADNCCSTKQPESSTKENISCTTDKMQTNGLLDPFRSRNFTKITADPILESILNLINTKRIDLSKLDQTSCVYCYIAPIVTHTLVSSHVTCSQKARFVAEYRQHSFSPHWLLYNDSSCGLRMANLQIEFEERMTKETRILDTSTPKSESDLKESIAESEDSITEVWAKNYTNYKSAAEKDSNICEDLNVDVTDCLFSVINTEPLVSRVDDVSLKEAQ
ncbi:uncharacterized protein DDB_G0283357-like [Hylaeus anthracinus]|uniref:uncharacterized protein DDB_G0283357-like n=1 Tax=Hylaeus anthracinus TaxID=313031 RepID=UPI0023B91A8F|nr:uncharacterized protein DDB_G0283357-like [Hylaeus anthracinus]